jgi:arylsulfatase A-like enzyme
MNVPLAVMGLPERCPQPAQVSRPVGHLDIVPTILDVLGVPEGMNHQGISLCETDNVVRPLFAVSRAFRLQNAVIYGAKKHIVSLDGYPQEAFDLHVDPTERTNLAANREFTHDTDRLLKAFEQIQRKHHLRLEHWQYKAPKYEGEFLSRMLSMP